MVTAKVKAGWKTYKLSCKVTVKKKAGTTVVPPANTQEPAVVNPGDSSSAVKTAEPVKEWTNGTLSGCSEFYRGGEIHSDYICCYGEQRKKRCDGGN